MGIGAGPIRHGPARATSATTNPAPAREGLDTETPWRGATVLKAVTQLNPDNTYTAHIEDHEGDGPVGRGETPLEALLDLAERLATTLEAEAVLEAIRDATK